MGMLWYYANATAPKIVSIDIATLPSTTSYTHGDTINFSGMVVNAVYKNGKIVDVTSSCTKSATTASAGTTTSSSATQSITVSYTDQKQGITFTDSFNITVSNPLQSISITTQPTTKLYRSSASISTSGMVVRATMKNGQTKNVSASVSPSTATFSGYANTSTETVSYTESGVTKTTTYTIDRADIYLYDNGNEVTSNYGSWTSKRYWNDYDTGVLTKEATRLYLNCTGPFARSMMAYKNTLIDMTPFKTISVTTTNYTANASSCGVWLWTSTTVAQNPVNYNAPANATAYVSTKGNSTYSINVSNLTANSYVIESFSRGGEYSTSSNSIRIQKLVMYKN